MNLFIFHMQDELKIHLVRVYFLLLELTYASGLFIKK